MKDYEGWNLLVGLADAWNNFYRELLPKLQVIFFNVLPVGRFGLGSF